MDKGQMAEEEKWDKWDKEFWEVWKKALNSKDFTGLTKDDLPVAKTFFFAGRRRGQNIDQTEIRKVIKYLRQWNPQDQTRGNMVDIADRLIKALGDTI